MEATRGEIVYPTVGQVCEVNCRMIELYGGRFYPPQNLQNLSALEYVLDAISSSIYGIEMYPTLKEKAAALAYHIISRHVFINGCKRTGTHMAFEFLRSNGVKLFLEPSIVDLADAIAKGDADDGDLLNWLHGHQEE